MPNALIHESSPYLLQHANNPVNWLAWSEEAFVRAARENKPVFLSIGYSTCHWCHVMEHESFENEIIAALMNEHFINIKVDREEMPDIDAAYMAFVQASSGHGGWPLSLWLTPTAEPILGGTYFPPEDRSGRAGFPRICREVARLWQENPQSMRDNATRMLARLQAEAAVIPARAGLADEQVFMDFLKACERQFDAEYGGFGHAPKFPRPSVLRTLMQISKRPDMAPDDSHKAWEIVDRTLTAMIHGGIHDHLGGGFHRYSVDRHWHIPHYEKMLYDQAQIADACLDAWQLSQEHHFRVAAEAIFHYLLATLRDVGGAFHAAEDADSLPVESSMAKREGAYWTWEMREISDLLDPRSALIFSMAYGIEAAGNAAPDSDPHGELIGQNTLFRAVDDDALAERFAVSVEEIRATLTSSRKILLDQRALRPQPHRDDKIITAWNGLAISTLVRGARILGRADLASAAAQAMTFVRNNLWDGETLHRSFRGKISRGSSGPADYAFLIDALIELHGLFPGDDCLELALLLQSQLDRRFWSDEHQGYVMRPQVAGNTLLCLREDYDGAEPSPNHVAALNLLKLSALHTDNHFTARAEALLCQGAAQLQQQPFSAPVLLAAMDSHQRGIITWDFQGRIDPAVEAKIFRSYHPHSVFTRSPGDGVIILCEGNACRLYESSP